MSPAAGSDPKMSIQLNRKLLFSANQKLTSVWASIPEPPNPVASRTDPWNVKPPDFTPKLYRTLDPRINKKTLKLPELKHSSEETPQRFNEMFPVLIPKLEEKRNKPEFIALYKPPDLLQIQIFFVKSGSFPRCVPYEDPKPHNFRPCDENLPGVVTYLQKDPENLNFKTQLLEANVQRVVALRAELSRPEREPPRTMNTFKPAELKWDPALILPKSPYPPKSASYTRHRRRRGAHSAFMERVEEKLTRSWIKA